MTRILFSLTAVLLLVACSNDSATDEPAGEQRELTLVPYVQQMQMVSDVAHRALPAGFEPYVIGAGTTMVGFIAPQRGNAVAARIFTIGEDETQWKTNITIDDTSAPYYLYGFMPVGEETSTDIALSMPAGITSYQEGARLTIRNMKALSMSDACTIVGVKKGTGLTTGVNDPSVSILQGQFEYLFDTETKPEYVYLLFDHLMGALDVQMKVSDAYSTLRRICIKSMHMAPMTAKTVDAVVDLTANSSGLSPLQGVPPVTFSVKTAGQGETIELYKKPDGSTGKELTTVYQTMSVCYAACNVTRFKLTTQYDVYDRAGTLVREDCMAENTFDLGLTLSDLKPGYVNHVRINVDPTYIHVLSDSDLDNPSFIIN